MDAVLTASRANGDSTSRRTVSWLSDSWGASKANLWRTANNRTGCYESFSCRLVASRVDVLLLDDGGLVTGSRVSFVAAHAAARVRAHVFDLPNVATARFNVVKNDASLVLFTSLVAYEAGLGNEGLICRGECRIGHQLTHTASTGFGSLLLNTSPTASLPTHGNHLVRLSAQAHLINFIDDLVSGSGWVRRRTLRRGFLKLTSVPDRAFRIESISVRVERLLLHV